MRRRNPKRKTLYTRGKKRLLKILGKKRLSQTKMERRAAREQWKQTLGYYPAKLSEQVEKPSRYTRKGIRKITGAEGRIIREEFIVRRVHKGGPGKAGSARGEGPVRYGTAAAVRIMIKKSKPKRKKSRGQKTKREKRKKKKGR